MLNVQVKVPVLLEEQKKIATILGKRIRRIQVVFISRLFFEISVSDRLDPYGTEEGYLLALH